MTEPTAPHPLEYATAREPSHALWLRWCRQSLFLWRRLSLVVAALILLIPVYVLAFGILDFPAWSRINHFLLLLPLFLTGAIARGRWRGIWIGAAMCAAGVGLAELLRSPAPNEFRPYTWLTATFVPLLGFGVAEWIGCKVRDRGSLIWLVAAAAGSACLITIADTWLRYTGVEIPIPVWRFGPARFPADWALRPVLEVIIAGSFIPMAVRAKRATRRGMIIGIASLSALGALAILSGPMLMPMARRSAFGHGPFSPESGIKLIDLKGDSTDVACLYQVVAVRDASQTRMTHCWGPSVEDQCLEVLSRRDSAQFGPWLSSRFRTHPDSEIAERYCGLFAAQHRYETAPLLLRYLFMDLAWKLEYAGVAGNNSVKVSPIISALDSMGISQMARIRGELRWSLSHGAGKYLDNARRALVMRLLDLKAEPDQYNWKSLIDNATIVAATPLAANLQGEADQIATAGERLIIAEFRLAVSGINPHGIERVYLVMARTTDEFVREVDRYIARVDKAIEQAR